MKPLALNTILERIGDRAGMEKVHPCRFRHTFATRAIRSHAREIDVQGLPGHTSLTQVQRYARTYSSEAVVAAHEQFSPVRSSQPPAYLFIRDSKTVLAGRACPRVRGQRPVRPVATHW